MYTVKIVIDIITRIAAQDRFYNVIYTAAVLFFWGSYTCVYVTVGIDIRVGISFLFKIDFIIIIPTVDRVAV